MEKAITLILAATIFTGVVVECQNYELEEAKLKIAGLESIPTLNAKTHYITETDKKIDYISLEIDNLTTALSQLQHHSSRINALEEEVRLLWDAARNNNFEIYKLEFKAQGAEKRLQAITSQVEKMADIVSEKWIQIQQLEQALQMAEMRTLKVKRQLGSNKCPFVKFTKNLLGRHLETLEGILHPYGSYSNADPNSYWGQALLHVRRTFASARQYHYEVLKFPYLGRWGLSNGSLVVHGKPFLYRKMGNILSTLVGLQRFVKQEIVRNEFPAALANEEVVFVVASALIVFPILSAFIVLFSHFS